MTNRKAKCKKIWKEVFKDEDTFIDHFLKSYYSNDNMLTIEQNNRIISMIHLLPFNHKGKEIGLIYALATKNEERNKGYATKLINAAIDKGKEQGYHAIMLIPENHSLHGFYEKFGFKNSYKVEFELPDDFDFGIDDKANEFIKILPLNKKFIMPNSHESISLKWNTPECKKSIIEYHPWEPFLPDNAKILILGSFPPQRKRWSMDFYYPNKTNDFWKIMGLIFFGNENQFISAGDNIYDLQKIKSFLQEKGIALYDAATAIIRTKDNASDQYLQIVESTDITALLEKIPSCNTIAVTGEKAAQTILQPYDTFTPKIGSHINITLSDRNIKLYRMPSTSRAYPLALSKKAAFYEELFKASSIL